MLARRIDRILRESPAAAAAFWGIQAETAEGKRVLYSLNADKLFAPASNTKLFTSALALARLGADHRFRTVVRAEAAPDSDGCIRGDLTLAGGGDPELDLAAIESLAAQTAGGGVRRVEGDVIGDDSAYAWDPFPRGWEQDDTVRDYGAPVSALTVNDNVLRLRLAGPGGVAVLRVEPPVEYYSIDNRVRIGPAMPERVYLERIAGSRQVRLWGTMPAEAQRPVEFSLAIDDPALYAAFALRDALQRHGIAVAGTARARHWYGNEPAPGADLAGTLLASLESRRLWDILAAMNKNSVNLYGEMLLREVARARGGAPKASAGLAEMTSFLKEAGVTEAGYHFADGSGLSGLNLVSPGAVMKLLRFMYAGRERDAWMDTLPVAGQDGTLAGRFRGTRAAKRLQAKTGTLSHASALSGYVSSRRHGVVAFSILANNYSCPAEKIRAIIDRIALAIAE